MATSNSSGARRSAARRRRNRRITSGTGIGSRLLVTLVVVAVVLLSIAIFFRVRTVEVRGNSIYSADAVIEASGLHEGDNLLAINKSAVAGQLKARLPYVEQVRVSRILPDRVVLEIRENDAAFTVRTDGGETWLMSFSGAMLEKVTGAAAREHPAVTGFTVTSPVAGQPAASAETENLAAALTVLSAMEGTGLADRITALDVTRTFDLTMTYSDQYQVKLGSSDQMEYKIQYLLAVLDQLSQYQTGTIDLTFEEEKVARFIPQ